MKHTHQKTLNLNVIKPNMGFTGNTEGRGTRQTPQRENKGKMWVILQDNWTGCSKKPMPRGKR